MTNTHFIDFRACESEADFKAVISRASDAQLIQGHRTGIDLAYTKNRDGRHASGLHLAHVVGWIEEEMKRRGL